ncbi:type IV pilus secretin PilQ family protein [Xanthomonas campestris pv. campestris]|uniref:type IV pilus secretin PilQ n=1 Tax=Xanthomonas campestris TaxID=339 RepID=UPI001F39B162|nr:type IV pilus secretin PilQ family protein [Xanthomonas campestris]MEA9551821.1 type IV pilus secretin PilQ family protein [Xanthomonas campestris]MEB1026716.1 type IV pilus secretin PilQ family protein [Xanthomonas campestris pv. campestris]MEB1100272.1 type IV pilus secretin PilQ family protein [Xanthomonas campestris pv. campestris]MEB1135268.1 type IV pilus secretin PilQ family protein [Xanthomonas campestris pv. campestris]MEB1148211.1 type IV pilus secretin PilQ family protein [Xantho
MTFSNAQRLRPVRRQAMLRACALGFALALASGSSLAAAALAQPAQDPAKTAPASLAVSKIDFKRGDDGAGRLILQFDGQGASPDLRTQGDNVLVDISNARLPAELQRPLNVTDFATPVQRVEVKPSGGGSQLVLSTKGAFDSLAYQTGNEYVVEITPRKGQPAVGGVSVSAVTQAAAQIAARGYSGRPVTFNFQDVPVRTVLQLIAEESNLNIVASDTVQGNVTLRLMNVPWDQALDIVLRAKGLDKRRDGGVVWVAPQPELAKFEQDKEDARIAIENREDLITDYVQINYHNAAVIFKALTEAKGIGGGGGGGGQGGQGGAGQQDNGFLSPRGRLVADERTNTLMISDIPKKVAQMRELISHIDRPVDQVLIESRIVIATDTFARDLGARFGVTGATGRGILSGSLESNVNYLNTSAQSRLEQANGGQVTTLPAHLFPSGLNVDLGAGGFTNSGAAGLAYTLLGSHFNLDIELSAMQEEGRGEVVSNPRIVTANQREGVIKQGREIGYVTISGAGVAGGGSQANVQFKEVLLELKVTPTITNDNRVFLNMNVKKDEVARFITLPQYGTVPEINRREVNTAVLVADGETVVIGGVYEFTDRESVAKVPFLGDIPFLGNLFKKRGRSKEKAELLVFVTPKVLRVASAAR